MRVMIADNQRLVRESLKLGLEDYGFEIVATVSDGVEAFKLLNSVRTDVLLIDVVMPNGDGVEAIRNIRSHYPEVKVIVLTESMDDAHIYNTFKYAVSGYMLKSSDLAGLKFAIESVYAGDAVIFPRVAAKLIDLFSKAMMSNVVIDVSSSDASLLTAGEWRIIDKVWQGLSNKEIATELKLSVGTVRNHISVILDKLRLKNRTQLAIWAVQYRIRNS